MIDNNLLLSIKQYILNQVKNNKKELVSYDDICKVFNLDIDSLKNISKYICHYLLSSFMVEDVDIVDDDSFVVILKNSRVRCRG